MADRPKTPLTVAALAGALLAAGCDATSEGAQAYRGGHFGDALAAFRAAETRAGSGASPELLYDKALAAVRTRALDEAEAAAEAAATRGGPEFAALSDFLRGNIAFARSDAAEVQADLPSAGDALDRAIVFAEEARVAWQRAASARSGWPAAERNVKRAELLIEHLKARKAEAAKKKDGGKPGAKPDVKPTTKPPDPNAPDAPPLPPPPDPRTKPPAPDRVKEPESALQTTELSRAEVGKLLEKLTEKEKEKLALRRTQRQARAADVEKDW